jgi:hypothetical protein
MGKDLAKVTVVTKAPSASSPIVYENVTSIGSEDGLFEIEQDGKTHYWPFESVEHMTVEE